MYTIKQETIEYLTYLISEEIKKADENEELNLMSDEIEIIEKIIKPITN